MTGFSQSSSHYLPDFYRTVGVRGFRAFGNDASGGAFTVLGAPDGATAMNVAFAIGGNAEPEADDPVYMMIGCHLTAPVSFDGGAFVIDADVLPLGNYNDNPWGKILLPKTNISVTTTGDDIDNGALTSTGYIAYLAVFATSSGDYSFVVEHGVDTGSYATLASFTLDGSAIASEALTSQSATVNRYTRLVATKTTGSCTVFCGLVRL